MIDRDSGRCYELLDYLQTGLEPKHLEFEHKTRIKNATNGAFFSQIAETGRVTPRECVFEEYHLYSKCPNYFLCYGDVFLTTLTIMLFYSIHNNKNQDFTSHLDRTV